MSTTGTSELPDYAPVPHSALGPALNEQGYYVGRLERNLYWVTDGTYQSAFLTTSDGVVLLDAPPTTGNNLQRAVDEIASANGVSNRVSWSGRWMTMLSGEWFAPVPGEVDALAADLEGAGVLEVPRQPLGGVQGRPGRDGRDRGRTRDREVHRRARRRRNLHREHDVPGAAVHPARPRPRRVHP